MEIREMFFSRLKEIYPQLRYDENENSFILAGELILNHVYNDVRMNGKFEIEIIVPREYPLALPTVVDVSDCIDKNYPHRYTDGRLCLASEMELKMYVDEKNDICNFIDDFIIPYFYTYRYFKQYGVYPFGERSHGIMGDIEYIKDLFGLKEVSQVYNVLNFISNVGFRGHHLCPCNSQKRLRDCHGDVLMQMINSGLRNDCDIILSEIHKQLRKGNNG